MRIELARNALSHYDEDPKSSGEGGLKTDPIHLGKKVDLEESSAATLPSDEPRNMAGEEAQRVVKICKACMVSQQGGGSFCVKCGAELVPIRAIKKTRIGEVVNEKYRIVEAIGSGGMGDVFLGLNEPLGQKVAIKFLNQKFTSDEKIVLRFLNEARSYCRVNHPNAVTLLEYGQHTDGSLYLITEFIDGKSLTDVIREVGPLSTEVILSVGMQVCEVLNAAQKQGVIHRDLKPDNLMLVEGSRGRYAVKVLDFGIAKIADDDNGAMTETGSVFGTPEFMSPEQARGDTVDSRCDLYALGIILYFMATARLPFRGKNKFAILNKQLNEEPRPPSKAREGVEVHPSLEEIILECLQKDRTKRYQSAEEIIDALESVDLSWRPKDATKRSERRRKDKPVEAKKLSYSSEFDEKGDGALLNASTFDDEMASLSSHIINDEEEPGEIDPLGPTVEERESKIRQDPRFGSDFEDEEPMDTGELLYRVDPNLRAPLRIRSVAITLVVTIAVVAAVILLTRPSEESGQVGLNESPSAQGLVAQARKMAILETANVLVERGDFAAADLVLASIDGELTTEAEKESFQGLVRRGSRARNEEMQIRGALNQARCDYARDQLVSLSSLSPGAAANLVDDVENCKPGSTRSASTGSSSRSGEPAGTAPPARTVAEPAPTPAPSPTPSPAPVPATEQEEQPQDDEEQPSLLTVPESREETVSPRESEPTQQEVPTEETQQREESTDVEEGEAEEEVGLPPRRI